MKTSVAAALFLLEASFANAFELPFTLPFGLDSFLPFGKGASPELFALHKSLINIPSVTGEEHEIGVFLAEYLTERNYTVERIPSFPLLLNLLTK